MKEYIGTKMVKAEPALRLDDGKGNVRIAPLSGNPIPESGDTVDMGYRVRYPDGYESWNPQGVFEEAYREVNGMNFGLAIEAMKKGAAVARKGWNGKEQYVFLAEGDSIEFYTAADMSELLGRQFCVGDMLVLRTAQGDLQPGWLASQADMLADDWYIAE